jgi:hypothetical protein
MATVYRPGSPLHLATVSEWSDLPAEMANARALTDKLDILTVIEISLGMSAALNARGIRRQ